MSGLDALCLWTGRVLWLVWIAGTVALVGLHLYGKLLVRRARGDGVRAGSHPRRRAERFESATVKPGSTPGTPTPAPPTAILWPEVRWMGATDLFPFTRTGQHSPARYQDVDALLEEVK